MNLVLSDFDGTITTHDSLRDFLLYAVGYKKFLIKMFPVIPWLIGYILRIADNQKVKKIVTKQFFTNFDLDEFNKKAENFALKILDRSVRPHIIDALRKHKLNGDKVIVVSASFTDYLKYWCNKEGFELISTKLEVKDNKITGEFATPNCWGAEKIRRLSELFSLNNLHDKYEKIFVYADSPNGGDKEMLELGDEKIIVK